ncbi:hypothetical protein KQ872_03150 [Mycoplasma sp. ES3225-GEN-MYC]|uniref:Uncharacterized protein n=1 Tax=Mycoplasma miroungigenitalium TaxID=754515 RepID=A0A6M4JCN3_9MOLU|nr:hypothetical protein [Mycoplasma miroungigenitalium]MBU4691944.1 hypothetical protein [Mycoplasma miroungigenitalium]QJR43796.1 hypothetical protein HLA87_03355 [Mycoplasma miroungigenitalium]
MNINRSTFKPTPKPYFAKLERKTKNEIIATKTLNIGLEFLKFLLLVLVTTSFVLVQYSDSIFGNTNVNSFFKKAYLYTIGLSFGDLIIFFMVGLIISLIINWTEASMKKYYCFWLRTHSKVDYWIIRKRLKMFVWITLLVVAIIYHWALLSQRSISSLTLYTTDDMKNIFIQGWYYSFTQVNKELNLPNATHNIGVFGDTILNVLHCICLGPWIIATLLVILVLLSWIYLLLLNPKEYFKYLLGNNDIFKVRNYLKKPNSVFYYTPEVKRYFSFLLAAAKTLEINPDSLSFNKLIKLVKKNIADIAANPLTSEYFVNPNSSKAKIETDEEKFEKFINEKLINQQIQDNIENPETLNEEINVVQSENSAQIDMGNETVCHETDNLSQNTNTIQQTVLNEIPTTENITDINLNEGNFTEVNNTVITNDDSTYTIVNTTENENLQEHDRSCIFDENNDEHEELIIDKTIELRSVDTDELQNQTVLTNIDAKGATQTNSIELNINSENKTVSDNLINNSIDASKETKVVNKPSFVLLEDTEELKQPEEESTKEAKNIDKKIGFITIDTAEIGTNTTLISKIDKDELNKNNRIWGPQEGFIFDTSTFEMPLTPNEQLEKTQQILLEDEDDGTWINPFE